MSEPIARELGFDAARSSGIVGDKNIATDERGVLSADATGVGDVGVGAGVGVGVGAGVGVGSDEDTDGDTGDNDDGVNGDVYAGVYSSADSGADSKVTNKVNNNVDEGGLPASQVESVAVAKLECALARERQALEQIALIRGSVSWRLTAPLRAVKRFWPF